MPNVSSLLKTIRLCILQLFSIYINATLILDWFLSELWSVIW